MSIIVSSGSTRVWTFVVWHWEIWVGNFPRPWPTVFCSPVVVIVVVTAAAAVTTTIFMQEAPLTEVVFGEVQNLKVVEMVINLNLVIAFVITENAV